MKWITREHPRVDRVACPWLIERFIDKEAEFLYVPAADVVATTERVKATPYDVKDVELGHHGPECSFDAFVHRYELDAEPSGRPPSRSSTRSTRTARRRRRRRELAVRRGR